MTEDDPEARIRQLEQPLSEMARASEIDATRAADVAYVPPDAGSYPPPPGYPPPPDYPPLGYPSWTPPTVPYPEPGGVTPTTSGNRAAVVVPIAIAVLAVTIAGVVTFFLMSRDGPTAPGPRPDIAGGGATLAPDERIAPGSGATPTPGRTAPSVLPSLPPASPTARTAPPGSTITVSGIEDAHVVRCDDNLVSISGVENTVTITGRCTAVNVSGMNNVVNLDASVTISVSGFDNRVVFRDGDPEVATSGSGNTVERG